MRTWRRKHRVQCSVSRPQFGFVVASSSFTSGFLRVNLASLFTSVKVFKEVLISMFINSLQGYSNIVH